MALPVRKKKEDGTKEKLDGQRRPAVRGPKDLTKERRICGAFLRKSKKGRERQTHEKVDQVSAGPLQDEAGRTRLQLDRKKEKREEKQKGGHRSAY